MPEVTITQLENYLAEKYQGKASATTLFMKLVEEVGEVAEAMNQQAGRKAITPDVSLEKELADLIHYAVAIAAVSQIDLNQVIIDKDQQATIKYPSVRNLTEFLQDKNKAK